MGIEDDPKHPLYPAFKSLDDMPPKAWMVIYQGLSGAWLATSPFYIHEAALNLGASLHECDVKIVELTVTNVEDFPLDERLVRYKKKTKFVRDDEPKKPKVRRVRKVKQPPPEDDPDDGVPEEPLQPKKMKVRKVRKATQAPLFDEEGDG